jgi:hypothetical protein
VLQVRYHLQVPKTALRLALLPHCDLSSPSRKLSLISLLHECLQEGHRAQLPLPLEVAEHRQEEEEAAVVVVVEHHHPLEA